VNVIEPARKILPGIILAILFTFHLLPYVIFFRLENCKCQSLDWMKNLNKTETKNTLRVLLDRDYNYTELLTWEHNRLNYTTGKITRYTDPLQILSYGKGRCQEFSILYVALCLASGYSSRLVIDVFGDHTWAEIKLDGIWVHVDPSESRIADPYMYEKDWGKHILLVYAFADGSYEDVTTNYATRKQNYYQIIW